MYMNHERKQLSLLSTVLIVLAVCLEPIATAEEPVVKNVNLIIAIGKDAYLPCLNSTPGNFYGVSWTLISETFPRDIYSYIIDQGTFAHLDRSTLINETSLTIRNVTGEDSGTYHCNLIYYSDTHKSYKVMVPSIVTLNVILPPKAYITPKKQIVSIGDDVTLTCRSVGSSKFNVTWMRNDSFDLSLIADDVRTRRLRLNNIDGRADGIYKCNSENLAGRDFQYARIIVKVPPTILASNPVHINVEKSGQVDCIAKGYPLATFEWRFVSALGDEISLPSGDKFSNKYEALPTVNSSDGQQISSLVLRNVNKNDFRMYTCYAKNSEGVTSRNLSVTGYAYAQKPIILDIRTSGNKAIVSWNVAETGGTELISLTLQYRNGTGREMWKSIQITPATVKSYTIMDLDANTRYEFRMFATNAVGDSPTSATVTAWTKRAGQVRQATNSPGGGLLDNLGLTALIGIVAGALVALFIAIIIVCLLVRRLQKTTNTSQTASPPHSRPVSMENGSSHGSRRPSMMPDTGSAYRMELEPLLFQQSDQWEFPRNQLRVSTVLGSGAFGMVMRGEAHGLGGATGPVKVAIKMVRDITNDIAKKDLQAELDVLKLIALHANVVGLKGCCSIEEPLMVIVEYCANGDLQGFLRSSRGISERYYRASYGGSVPNLTSKMLLTFACHIARGMSHLSSLKVIHRDLAARNVLVDDRLVCKVSDFGFARDVYVEDHYMKKSQGGRFPIKWMAIESLIDGISTTKSDVWSFGVVLWEIVTLGASPYPGMNSYEVVSFLQDGYRMEKPKHCSDEIYRILLECWNVAPQRRTSFNDLADKLYEMAHDTRDYINMNFYQDHLYENFDVSLTGQSNNTESESNQQKQPPPLQPQKQQPQLQVTTDL